jgi:hypothetical protein
MIKVFFILILMQQNAPAQDYMYLLTEPTFNNPRECLTYVGANQYELTAKMSYEFPTQDIETVYCLSKEALDKLIKVNNNNQLKV